MRSGLGSDSKEIEVLTAQAIEVTQRLIKAKELFNFLTDRSSEPNRQQRMKQAEEAYKKELAEEEKIKQKVFAEFERRLDSEGELDTIFSPFRSTATAESRELTRLGNNGQICIYFEEGDRDPASRFASLFMGTKLSVENANIVVTMDPIWYQHYYSKHFGEAVERLSYKGRISSPPSYDQLKKQQLLAESWCEQAKKLASLGASFKLIGDHVRIDYPRNLSALAEIKPIQVVDVLLDKIAQDIDSKGMPVMTFTQYKRFIHDFPQAGKSYDELVSERDAEESKAEREEAERVMRQELDNDLEYLKKEGSLNHYQILGLEPSATNADIKKAYNEKSLVFHPDKKGGDSTSITQQLNHARDVLIDATRRSAYDRMLKSYYQEAAQTLPPAESKGPAASKVQTSEQNRPAEPDNTEQLLERLEENMFEEKETCYAILGVVESAPSQVISESYKRSMQAVVEEYNATSRRLNEQSDLSSLASRSRRDDAIESAFRVRKAKERRLTWAFAVLNNPRVRFEYEQRLAEHQREMRARQEADAAAERRAKAESEREDYERQVAKQEEETVVKSRLKDMVNSGSPTLYSLLGVESKDSIDTIKNAYKQKMTKIHPDKFKASDDEGTKKIIEAYAILLNPRYREIYDDLLKARELQSRETPRPTESRASSQSDFKNACASLDPQSLVCVNQNNIKFRLRVSPQMQEDFVRVLQQEHKINAYQALVSDSGRSVGLIQFDKANYEKYRQEFARNLPSFESFYSEFAVFCRTAKPVIATSDSSKIYFRENEKLYLALESLRAFPIKGASRGFTITAREYERFQSAYGGPSYEDLRAGTGVRMPSSGGGMFGGYTFSSPADEKDNRRDFYRADQGGSSRDERRDDQRPGRYDVRDDRSGDQRSSRYDARDDRSGDQRSSRYDARDDRSGDQRSSRYDARDDRSGDQRSSRYDARDDRSGDQRSGRYDARDDRSGNQRSSRYDARDDRSGDQRSSRYDARDDRSGDQRSGRYDARADRSGDQRSSRYDARADRSGDQRSSRYDARADQRDDQRPDRDRRSDNDRDAKSSRYDDDSGNNDYRRSPPRR
jgi:curved DNA-binding protein CbpA